ncbi:hypothetical protein FE772_08345 [Lysobacter enzymogenes]|nr:hypothetical protein [Lysobacter enzymogenes]QCW25676.1 hypothetical protein FE772_08345 [Lysobacter enzymogenes]
MRSTRAGGDARSIGFGVKTLVARSMFQATRSATDRPWRQDHRYALDAPHGAICNSPTRFQDDRYALDAPHGAICHSSARLQDDRYALDVPRGAICNYSTSALR